MANIQKRKKADGSTTYRVQVRLKGVAPQYASFDRIADARRWAAEVESGLKSGRLLGAVEARSHTFGDAVDRYIREVSPKRPRSARDRERELLWWCDRIGARATLAEVTPSLIVQVRDELARGIVPGGRVRAPASVNRYLAAISHLFTVAVKEWQWVSENPVLRVGKLSEPRGRVRCLSEDELERLLTTLEQSHRSPALRPITWIALSTGLRRESILELKWSDVDLEAGTVRVQRTKNGDPLALPLVGTALDLLREMSGLRRIDTPLVFPSPTLAQPLEIDKMFARAVVAAGIEDFHFHDLRHCVGSFLAMSGASPAEIAAVLGHRTWAMSARYTHPQNEHVRGLLENMVGSFLKGGSR